MLIFTEKKSDECSVFEFETDVCDGEHTELISAADLQSVSVVRRDSQICRGTRTGPPSYRPITQTAWGHRLTRGGPEPETLRNQTRTQTQHREVQ